MKLYYISEPELKRIRESEKTLCNPYLFPSIVAAAARFNALYMVQRAGSGHLGTSFSVADLESWLWTQMVKMEENGIRDICFSSKGHDAPMFYSLMILLGHLDFKYIHELRRLNGLPGHPDIGTLSKNGDKIIETNTGSLGMGISKAKGFAIAGRLNKEPKRIYVITGDGELQEGQIWESLQQAANEGLKEITVIVDHNKIQSDTFVRDVNDLGDICYKFRAFGWIAEECNGHDFFAIDQSLANLRNKNNGRPQVLVAHTVKGKGVSFMEKHKSGELYQYHSVALKEEEYKKAASELHQKISKLSFDAGLGIIRFQSVDIEKPAKKGKKIMPAYGEELVKIARERKDIVVLDADLITSHELVEFKKEFPARFVECGIAEQDMVSISGGLALRGKLPIAHTYSCFFARAVEQMYNNATEKTKIIYVSSMSGLLPAYPGHSHQAVLDIALFGGIPGLTMIQPCCEEELRMAFRWAIDNNTESTYLRVSSVASEVSPDLFNCHELKYGEGACLYNDGYDVALIAYGQVMIYESYKVTEILKKEGICCSLFNFPWLNRINIDWLKKSFFNPQHPYRMIVTIDDHYEDSGQGVMLRSEFLNCVCGEFPQIMSFGLNDIPACGQNEEVLKFHGLDAESIASNILNCF